LVHFYGTECPILCLAYICRCTKSNPGLTTVRAVASYS